MTPEIQLPSESTGKDRRRSRRRVLLAILLLITAGGFYVLFVPQPQVALGVLTSQADGEGATVTTGDVSSSPRLSAQATAISSNVNSSTSSTSARSDGATRTANSLAIFCESDHLLMQRVGLALFEGLKELSQFEQVQYVPHAQSLGIGQAVPDVLITIDMPSFVESGLPVALEYKAQFTARVGREFIRSSNYIIDGTQPPVLMYQAEMNMDYSGKQTGLETSGAKYTALSRDVAKHIQKSIVSFLEKQEGLTLPERKRIAMFYPEFQPAPELPVLQELGAKPKLQGPRFMQATSAAWTFTTDSSAEALNSLFEEAFSDTEWKSGRHSADNEPFSGVWSRGVEQWNVVPVKSMVHSPDAPVTTQPQTYGVTYVRGMSREAAQQAFHSLLDQEPNELTLLPFIGQWHHERDRLGAYFKSHPPTQVASIARVAEWEVNSGNTDAAREWVFRGATLDRLLNNGADRSQFEKLAKKLGWEKLPEEWDLAIIATLGLIDFREGQPITLRVTPDEELLIWLSGDEKEQRVAKLSVLRSRSGDWQLKHEVHEIAQGSRSSATSGPQTLNPDRSEPIWISHYGAKLKVVPHFIKDADALELTLTR